MSENRALACLVILDGQVWGAGSVPPPAVAARIRNPKCWQPLESEPAAATDPAPPGPNGDVIPAAAGTNGIRNLEPQPDETDQSAVIPAGTGTIIGRDPLESDGMAGESGPAAEIPPSELAEPPRSGKGASENAWRLFAISRGVSMPEGADRTAIIAACRQAGVIQ